MSRIALNKPEPFLLLEALEDRIAPANIAGIEYQSLAFGTDIILGPGEGLSTSDIGGSLILYVEKGQAKIFVTDLNGNGEFDANEITGISAGNGLRLTSFVDIHGDIVTNLNADGTITDSNPSTAYKDGHIVLDSKIEGITMRSVTAADLDGVPIADRIIQSTYSIYGSIYAGGGFGTTESGLLINATGSADQKSKFAGVTGVDYVFTDPIPSVGSIIVGTAVSGQHFSFGITNDPNDTDAYIGVYGRLNTFTPKVGQAGADIIGVGAGQFVTTTETTIDPNTGEEITTSTTSFDAVPYHIGSLIAGDGGFGGRGGDILGVSLKGDIGSVKIVAGNGGNGEIGGRGGNISGLTDSGSDLGFVLVQTGNGGEGLLGAGGAAGSLSLGEFKVAADTFIILGNSGDGLTAGGNGASFLGGKFAPTVDIGVPQPLKLVSTTRGIGDIGSPQQADFNGDGYGDVVFVTDDPQQMVVLYGAPDPSNPGEYIFVSRENLDAPEYTDARPIGLVVTDVNADGFDDIVTASNTYATQGGLWTYLFNPNLNDGDGGFENPIVSATPYFNDLGYFRVSQPVIQLAAGDFDGDGLVDIGVFAYTYKLNLDPATVLYIASGVPEVKENPLDPDVNSGLFSVNFGKTTGGLTKFPVYQFAVETQFTSGHVDGKLLATATDSSLFPGGQEILVGAALGNGNNASISTFNMSPGGTLLLVQSAEATYRPYLSPEIITITPYDITILDVEGVGQNGIFDIAVSNIQNGISILQGNASGTFSQPDGNGSLFAGEGGLVNPGSNIPTYFGMVALDLDGDGDLNQLGFYSLSDATGGYYQFDVAGFTRPDITLSTIPFVAFTLPPNTNTEVIVWDAYSPEAGQGFGYAFAEPNTLDANWALVTATNVNNFVQLVTRGLDLVAGDGGDAYLGTGGNGGVIANVIFLIPTKYDGDIKFIGGNGGDGFVNGGNGGSVSALNVTYVEAGVVSSDVQVFGGDGGTAINGKGGTGGSLSNLVIVTGSRFQGGDGGFGYQGGNGGTVFGRGNSASPDSKNDVMVAIGGDGGSGISLGGNGGSVTNLRVEFLPLLGGEGGLLFYQGGDGGSSISGKGGTGGNVTKSGPSSLINNLVGDVALIAGNGGFGQTGGAGGNVTDFVNSPTTSSALKAISVLAGNGGYGITGNGGVGGNIAGISATGSGLASTINPIFAGQAFNRFAGGDGGFSYGANGGNGGNVSGLVTNAQSASTVVASGAGGYGLYKGGNGGNVTSSSNINASAFSGSKVLLISGAGGDAYAVGIDYTAIDPKNPNFTERMNAIGYANGVGGNGGNITNVTQLGGTDVRVDLITGNGGSTVNYGTSFDAKFYIGKGGSISGIKLTGNAGDMTPIVAIKDYTAPGETYAEFVQDSIRDNPTVAIDNNLGNVGVIVGIGGLVRGDTDGSNQGTPTAFNGSVSTFTARNIMSMVAGSVDRLAKVLSVSGISISNGGTLGAYKNVPFAHPDTTNIYYSGPDQTGSTVDSPNIGGSLMDGAIFAEKLQKNLAGRVF